MAESGAAPTTDAEERVINTLDDLPLEDAVRQKLDASRELNILIVGCYQVGKSTLINSLFFKKGEQYTMMAKEGVLAACTKDVKRYTLTFGNCIFNIYDSPGLQDGQQEKQDFQYLKLIEKACPNIHLIIYCKKMGEPIRPAEKEALKNLKSAFEETSIWDNAIIALTFANTVEPADPDSDEVKYFEQIREKNVDEFSKAFEELSLKEEFEKLKTHIFPAGSARALQLPGMNEDWRIDFWRGCIDACKEEAKGALLKVFWRADHSNFRKVFGVSLVNIAIAIAGVVGGGGCIIVGTALTASGILAPVGIPLIAGGAVGAGLGVIAATGFLQATIKKNIAMSKPQCHQKNNSV